MKGRFIAGRFYREREPVTVPARSPVDQKCVDALDRLADKLTETFDARDSILHAEVLGDLLATVRSELERLREERAKTAEQGRVAAKRYSEEAERRMVAEAEVQRLTEGLRWMADYNMTGSERTLHIDFQGKARALLAGSEAEPVRREVKVDPAMFGESNRLLGEPDEGGAK